MLDSSRLDIFAEWHIGLNLRIAGSHTDFVAVDLDLERVLAANPSLRIGK
jgi:hypothetical protein